MENHNLSHHSNQILKRQHKHLDKESLFTCNHEAVLMVAARYGVRLHNYFYKTLHSSFDADDLLQELYAKLLSYHRPIRACRHSCST